MPHHVSRKLESSKNKDAALSTLPFSMGQAPPTGSSGRDDNPRKATRTPVGPCSARREAFLPYRHGPVCNSPSFDFCRICSVPLCQAAEQDFSDKKSYFDITFKNKKFLRRQRQPPETSSGGNRRRYGVAYTFDPTPHQSVFSPNGFLPMRKRAGRMVAALGADCFQVTFPS